MKKMYSEPDRRREALIKELKGTIKRVAHKLGKDVSWFQFAKKERRGYIPSSGKTEQCKALEQILTEVIPKFPEFTRGQMADILSELVNESTDSEVKPQGAGEEVGY